MKSANQGPGAGEFIEQLKRFRFRKKVLPALRGVREGDWEAIVKIAAAEGFHFTKEELKQAVPRGFYKGEGKRKDLGWSLDTLKN